MKAIPFPLTTNVSWFGLFAMILLLFVPTASQAQVVSLGRVTVEDLSMGVSDTRTSGYAECRYRVTNLSTNDAQRVRFQAPADTYGGPSLRPIVVETTVEPRKTRIVSFFLPPVPVNAARDEILVSVGGASGALDSPGRFGDVQASDLGVYDRYYYRHRHGHTRMPSVLCSSDVWQDRLRTRLENLQSSRGMEIVESGQPIVNWSQDWKAYSSHKVIIMTSAEFDKADAGVRDALTKYEAAGGRLLFYGDAKPSSWLPPHSVHGKRQSSRTDYRNVETQLTDVLNDWNPAFSDAAATRNMLGEKEIAIPFRGIFFIMLLFAILIGPFNVYLLDKKKRRIWLLWTVPVFSLLTCGIIFAFSLLSEGITAKYSQRTVTYLDQDLELATTIGVDSYNCPIAPGKGLRFDTDTVIQPLAGAYTDTPKSYTYGNGEQRLTRGWVASRVPMQIGYRKVNDSKLRLKIGTPQAGTLEVTNGLGVELTRLFVTSENGDVYATSADEPIAPGAKALLRKPISMSANGSASQNVSTLLLGVNNPSRLVPAKSGYAASFNEQSPFAKPGIDRVKNQKLDGLIVGSYTPEAE